MNLQVLHISDDKRGHDNQSIGLIEALTRLVSVQALTLTLHSPRRLGALGLANRILFGKACHAQQNGIIPQDGLPAQWAPQIVLGAGQNTHLPLLVAAKRYRARSVVLMDPGLMRGLFDLCIVPSHDALDAAPGRLVTEGALNRMRPCPSKRRENHALVLLGGPSSAFEWDNERVLGQVLRLCADGRHWTVATSRRTPAQMVARLSAATATVIPFDSVDSNWLPRTLPCFATVWVSEDSASMLYEALTVGAATGIVELPARDGARPGRVQRGLKKLCERGLAVRFADWLDGRPLLAPSKPLAEADRCARWLVEKWLVGA